jgi:hypothetical protein
MTRVLRSLLAVAACSAALLPAPAPARAADGAATAGDAETSAGERMVIAPLNLGVRAEEAVAPGIEPVWTELLRHFESQDPPPAALGRRGALALWAEVQSPSAGEAASDVYEAYARFARRLAEQVDFGVLVIPSLVVRPAKLQGEQAFWDGASRLVEVFPAADASGWEPRRLQATARGHRGSMSAASLHVALLGPDGSLRFEGAGGLALLQRLEAREQGSGWKVGAVAAPEPFGDAESLREGIRLAFETPLPASKAR